MIVNSSPFRPPHDPNFYPPGTPQRRLLGQGQYSGSSEHRVLIQAYDRVSDLRALRSQVACGRWHVSSTTTNSTSDHERRRNHFSHPAQSGNSVLTPDVPQWMVCHPYRPDGASPWPINRQRGQMIDDHSATEDPIRPLQRRTPGLRDTTSTAALSALTRPPAYAPTRGFVKGCARPPRERLCWATRSVRSQLRP